MSAPSPAQTPAESLLPLFMECVAAADTRRASIVGNHFASRSNASGPLRRAVCALAKHRGLILEDGCGGDVTWTAVKGARATADLQPAVAATPAGAPGPTSAESLLPLFMECVAAADTRRASIIGNHFASRSNASGPLRRAVCALAKHRGLILEDGCGGDVTWTAVEAAPVPQPAPAAVICSATAPPADLQSAAGNPPRASSVATNHVESCALTDSQV
jgi:hypothetical protein